MKTTSRLESLLKVIVTPLVCFNQRTRTIPVLNRNSDWQDPKENFILNYTILIGDASLINFQKVGLIAAVSVSSNSQKPGNFVDS